MGWIFTPNSTRGEIITEHTAAWKNSDGVQGKCLKHATRGNILWSIWEIIFNDDRPPHRFIGCDLLRNGGRLNGWGIKSMSESVHPYYYTCPLSYLTLVPEANAAWRTEVRAYHARLHQPLQIGMKVRFMGATIPYAVVVRLVPLCGIYKSNLYRIPRRLLAPADKQPYIEEETSCLTAATSN